MLSGGIIISKQFSDEPASPMKTRDSFLDVLYSQIKF